MSGDLSNRENKKQLEQLVEKIMGNILKCSLDSQSKIFLNIVKLILYIKSLFGKKEDIIWAVWLKLPYMSKKEFEVIKVSTNPPYATDYLNLLNEMKLPFHKEQEIKSWEKKEKELKEELNIDPSYRNKIKYENHLEKEKTLTSMTGKIYSKNECIHDPNVKWNEEKEKPYKDLIKDNWDNAKIRSVAGIPLVYNKKKLGVLMITSNIAYLVKMFELQTLSLFCFSLAKIIYYGAPTGFFGVDFVHLVEEAEDALL